MDKYEMYVQNKTKSKDSFAKLKKKNALPLK